MRNGQLKLRIYTFALRSGAKLLAYTATWITSRYVYEVQQQNLKRSMRFIEAGDMRRAAHYPGESWHERLALRDYQAVRAALAAATQLHPEAAIDTTTAFLGEWSAAEYFAPKLATAGFFRHEATE